MSNTIKAVIFDFGQTLVDSADGFRQAEKAAQQKLFSHLRCLSRAFPGEVPPNPQGVPQPIEFLQAGHVRELYHFYCLTPEDIFEKLEAEYWQIVKSKSILFRGQSGPERPEHRYAVALITTPRAAGDGTHRIRQFPELEKYFTSILVPVRTAFRLNRSGALSDVSGNPGVAAAMPLCRRRLAHRRLRISRCGLNPSG